MPEWLLLRPSLLREEYTVHAYFRAKGKLIPLTADDIDCIVAYIVPLNVWYVIPVEAISTSQCLWFFPHVIKKRSRFESFREAWWLLAPNLKETCTEQLS